MDRRGGVDDGLDGSEPVSDGHRRRGRGRGAGAPGQRGATSSTTAHRAPRRVRRPARRARGSAAYAGPYAQRPTGLGRTPERARPSSRGTKERSARTAPEGTHHDRSTDRRAPTRPRRRPSARSPCDFGRRRRRTRLPASAATEDRTFVCHGNLGRPYTFRTVTGSLSNAGRPYAVRVINDSTGAVDSDRIGWAGEGRLLAAPGLRPVEYHRAEPGAQRVLAAHPARAPRWRGFFDADLEILFEGGALGNWQIPRSTAP